MTEKEKDDVNYRFSGYQLPKIILDETGPAYTIMYGVHPYYLNQPMIWKKSPGNEARLGPLYNDNGLYTIN